MSTELFGNPGLEGSLAPWVDGSDPGNEVNWYDGFGVGGTGTAELKGFYSDPFGIPTARIGQLFQNVTCPNGAPIEPSIDVWAFNYEGSARLQFRSSSVPAGPLDVVLAEMPPGIVNPNDFIHWAPGVFTAPCENPRLGWYATSGSFPSLAWMLIDNASCLKQEVSSMARMLAELGVKASLAELQLSLNAEIAGVQTERGDGLVLPTVKSWFGFKRKPDPDTVEVQVYPTRIQLPRWSFDLSKTIEGQRGPLVSELDVLVQLTHANREGASTGQMIERGWRYVAAIERVFQGQPSLRQGPKLTVYGLEVEYDLNQQLGLNLDPHTCGAVGVRAFLRQQEDHLGETTASGGVAPTAVIEQV